MKTIFVLNGVTYYIQKGNYFMKDSTSISQISNDDYEIAWNAYNIALIEPSNIEALQAEVDTIATNGIIGTTQYGGSVVTNLNTINKNGFYTCYGTATGVPSAGYSWFVLHQNSNVGTASATQTAIAYSTDIITFVRNKIAGSWGSWKTNVASGKIVCGTVYNNAGTWAVLNDAEHTPIGIDSVSVVDGAIRVNYESINATEVNTMVVNSDETYAAEGYSFGVSVGLDYSGIVAVRNKAKGGYVYYNGTNFVVHPSYNNGIKSVSWAGGVLSVELDNLAPSVVKNVSVCGNGNSYIPAYGGDTAGVLAIQFVDFAGNVISTASGLCKVWVSVSLSETVNAANLNLSGGNIWIYGLFT